MRKVMALLHRWLGLFTALFLFVSGLTGAIISWDHELDAAINPEMYKAQWQDAIPPLQLANQLEANNPQLIVSFLPLEHEPNHALNLFISPRNEAADKVLGYNQLALHPDTGKIQAQRMWGEVSLARENILPFLYKLHYTMHIPDVGGYELGMLFMGVVGIVWVFDSLIALFISFPARRSWRKSFTFRLNKGWPKLNFDLHRSGGVWLWGLVLIVAVTSVSMNLGFQVVRPVVNALSPLTPSPFETTPFAAYSSPSISREQIVRQAQALAKQKGIEQKPGGIFYSTDFNLYGVGFFEPGNSHGDGGLGNPWLYFDAKTGEHLGDLIPGAGSAGDIFMQAQFPLHSGRILGVWGRALMSFLGLCIAGFAVTGVIIWLRKRRARNLKLNEITSS